VHGLTFNVLKLLMEADPPLFDECSASNRTEIEAAEVRRDRRNATWEKLEKQFASGNHRNEHLPKTWRGAVTVEPEADLDEIGPAIRQYTDVKLTAPPDLVYSKTFNYHRDVTLANKEKAEKKEAEKKDDDKK